MTFRENLEVIRAGLPETYFVTLMDRDGISVDALSGPESGIDLNACLVEFSNVFSQLERSSEQLAIGNVNELVVRSDKLCTVIHRVGDEYFLALALPPSGNSGKARYLLRMCAPKMLVELAA